MRFYVLTIFVIITLLVSASAGAIGITIGEQGVHFNWSGPQMYSHYSDYYRNCYLDEWGRTVCGDFDLKPYSDWDDYIYSVPSPHHFKWKQFHKHQHKHKHKWNKGW